MRALGYLLVGAVGGFIAGAIVAATYNHLECSTFTQALEGCRTVKPNGGGALGAIIGAIVGIVVAASVHRRERTPDA